MRRDRCCRLCGLPLKEKSCGEYKDWEVGYCSYLCYLTDQILPIPSIEDEKTVFSLPVRIMRLRYEMIVSGENDPVYKEKFEEEEDCISRGDMYND